MTTSFEQYKATIKNYFSFLKKTERLDELYNKAIFLPEQKGYLIPVCELHTQDQHVIEKLAAWRQKNAQFFPSQFPVTLEGTATWLRKGVLDVEDRILFLVIDPVGQMVGHLGYANGFMENGLLEIDNVVRGEKDFCPGIMHTAMQELISWAEEFIAPEQIFLRVFADNERAINFYKKLHFVGDTLLPLHKHIEGHAVFYRPAAHTETIDQHFLRLHYQPKP